MLFEGNTLHNLGYEVDDSGAFYVGRQWQARGNVVRGNTFRHIRARVPTYLGYPSVQGLYLDDQMSGYTIYDNDFIDVQTGLMLGGVSCHNIAAIWVAFFSRWQRYRC